MTDAREALPELDDLHRLALDYRTAQVYPDANAAFDAISHFVRAYGTACAKAARRAALEEAAKVCEYTAQDLAPPDKKIVQEDLRIAYVLQSKAATIRTLIDRRGIDSAIAASGAGKEMP